MWQNNSPPHCVQESQTLLQICISTFSAADCNCDAEVPEYPQTEGRRLCRCDRSVSASSAISLPRSSPCHGSCSSFTTTFISAYYLIFRGGMQVVARQFAGHLAWRRGGGSMGSATCPNKGFHFPQQRVSLPPTEGFTSLNRGFHFPQ